MNVDFKLSDALFSLYEGCSYVLKDNDYEQLEWNDTIPKPSKEELESEIVRLKEEWTDKQYQRLRAPEYPPIGDQLDALFHAGVFPPEMAAQIQAVKDKYPKGS
jgi:hypothetical protein